MSASSLRAALRLSAAVLLSGIVFAPAGAQTTNNAPGAAAAPTGAPTARPWADPTLSADARADLLVKAMTLDEKLQLTFGYFSTSADWQKTATKNWQMPKDGLPASAGFVPGIARLGVPAQWQTDAGIGVASQRTPTPRLRTALPSGIATAATWNPELAQAGGAMIGNEAFLSGFNVQLAGGMNLTREPRNGRNFEYSGEDPLLAGIMTGRQIKGIQSQNVVSTMKHFAFNGQETNRFNIDERIEEQAARQSDLLAFEIALEVGDPGSVMCAYNRVNGFYACENDWLLNRTLKQDWSYKGYVMSDWGATHSTTQAANAGLDQQSGWAFDRSPYFADALREAVNNGYVTEARATDMARRIVWAMFRNGLFDKPVAGDRATTIDYAADAAVTRADAEEGIVLLKNERGLLPVARSAKSILLIGAHADVGVLSGGGSSQVYPHGGPPNGLAIPDEYPAGFPGPKLFYPSSPMKALQARTGASVTYLDGKDVKAAAAAARKADLVIVFGEQWTGESIDAPDLNLPAGQDAMIAAVARANPRTVVVLETGGPVLMPWLKNVGAVLAAWYPGTSGGEAIARVLTGEVNPSGHLPATFPASLQQLPRPVIEGDPKLDRDSHPIGNYNIEGAAVGYKWFDKTGAKPLFPFGFGLSYTDFRLGGLSVAPAGKSVQARFSVTNTGRVAGKAVPQVYVAGAGWEAPKRLAGFEKVELAPGETRQVTVTVDPRLLATFDPATRGWRIADGRYELLLATSATDVVARAPVTLAAATLDQHGR
ncbi:beta-glucosidase [Sphingomonas sp. BE138]|uniref:beta-glucosidase family protein n=1 Tax=Sphingomonas sp. BE138 TaxID=2817845 RepID=UPI00286767E6|nr:glycoside hydrolase family 3 C-terminal domain-containing protein [Sphingomonas sp. BE138]MDR6787676.1 beta-glucosidase [Sphingomonas sp. BE138]